VRVPGHHTRKDRLTRCPVCGKADFFTEIEGRDFESGTGRYRVECCRQCGVRFTNPRPTAESAFELYRTRDSTDYVRSNRITDRLRSLTIRRWIGKVTAHAGRFESVLDYGCGDGFFAAQLARYAASADITAVDLHEVPPAGLNGHGVVHYRSFGQLRREPKRYQLIFCRQVIEHVPDPQAVAAELEALLAPGGMLVVEVPNYRSVWRKLFGRYYFALYLPRHLLHFDETTLKGLFGRYRQVKLYRNHTPILGKSLGYLTGMPVGNLGLFGLGLFPLQVAVDRICRSSTVLALVLRKKRK